MTDIDVKQQEIADQLLSGNFTKSGPSVTKLSDPLVDTPMVITLDQLKPYEFNPRIVRNPLFDEIKASIRERGLDAPPAITRRPDESHFIIRNGGNTRLTILNELWRETKDERFFKIHCLFRPWQGEIVALTGHLAENELHGQLTFIERALGVIKLGEIYQNELNVTLNQKQLAEKLTKEGYPISDSQISRMRETVNYLLPVIPNTLYGGLSRTKIDRISRLRKIAKITWNKYKAIATETITYGFDDVFAEILSFFDDGPDNFDFDRLQDELVGRCSKILGASYDLISLEFSEKDAHQKMIESPPSEFLDMSEEEFLRKPPSTTLQEIEEEDILAIPLAPVYKEPAVKITRTQKTEDAKSSNPEGSNPSSLTEYDEQARIDAHILSPADSTPRLDAIQGMIGELTGEMAQNFKTNVIQSIPVQAGGLYPISDIWYISTHIDNPEQLRMHIGQLVLEIADELNLANCIETTDTEIGFCYVESLKPQITQSEEFFMLFFKALASPFESYQIKSDLQNSLLTGCIGGMDAISDVAFVKLMRVYRLLRRYWQLQHS